MATRHARLLTAGASSASRVRALVASQFVLSVDGTGYADAHFKNMK
jgi:hypothetical protein